MLPASIIARKRDGHPLADAEIAFFIQGFVGGDVADYQMAAMAMAMCCRGLDVDETASLTRHMLASGSQLPRVSDRPRVDKHSTGGLGDKVSLILAPLLACFDVEVPMISGRGLGITGGTLDKLEAIPGFQVHLSADAAARQLRDVGAFIISASDDIAPADRKLYALRDVTGTVESVGLITASILSKKLAATLDALVMDVKVGSAAFMKTRQQAQTLADSLVRVGRAAGLPTIALLTDMDQPLGHAIGNAIEVNESLDVLEGGGPDSVTRLTVAMCGELLVQVKQFDTIANASASLMEKLRDGSAREKFDAMVAGQGGSISGPLPLAPGHVIEGSGRGFVESIDCRSVGECVIRLGGGRRRTGDAIDPAVGIQMHVAIGDAVAPGQPLMTVHAPPSGWESVRPLLDDVVRCSESPVPKRPLML